jgi:hypothetical protein
MKVNSGVVRGTPCGGGVVPVLLIARVVAVVRLEATRLGCVGVTEEPEMPLENRAGEACEREYEGRE